MGTLVRRGEAWRAMVRMRGQSRTRTFDTKAEAEAWIDRTEGSIRAGAPAPETVGGIKAADLFARYAAEIAPKKRGARWELTRLAVFSRSAEFDVPVADLDGAALAKWRDRRLKEVTAGTVNRDLNVISAVFSHAMLEWRLPLKRNPVRDLKRPPQPKGRTRRVSDAERGALCEQLGWRAGSKPETLQAWTAWAFCLSLETAMRQGEILTLTWRHVRERSVHLPWTKNGHTRDVPLSAAARALIDLLDHGRPEQRLTLLTSGTCGAYFREAATIARLTDLHFHDARHEAITRMATKLSIMDLARVSGHRDPRQLMGYYHPTADDLSALLD